MKIFFLGFFLICTFMTAQAQSFVSAQEASSIIAVEETADISALSSLQEDNPTYVEKKLNITAYGRINDMIDQGKSDVELIVMRSVISIAHDSKVDVSIDQYNNDEISDPDLQSLKNRLIQLLTE